MSSRKRKPAIVALSHLRIDKGSDRTLRRSLYTAARNAILGGGIPQGARLPSTRLLAAELSISRNTVADAFAQLISEGYLVARHGSGTFVAPLHAAPRAPGRPLASWEHASRRGRLLASRSSEDGAATRAALPFQPGLPSYEHFPFHTWARIAARILRNPTPDLLGYGDSAGYAPLRDVIAAELRSRDGQPCADDQIVIVGGTSQALDIIARVTLDPGDAVWLEDPSSLYARSTFAGAGATLVPVPVDEDGVNVRAGVASSPRARVAHVTSAHQWPLGATLSAERRAELLQWADDADAWIVEDEYDGVFRYDGTQPRSLRSLDRSERVIAVGSFSLTTFPAIRLGYIVAPRSLVSAFTAAKATIDRQASLMEQAILADFVYEGHFAPYRQKMRAIYAARRDGLTAQLAAAGAPPVTLAGAGLHVVLPLPHDADDRAIVRSARDAGVMAGSLSEHYLGVARRNGLILGFGAGSSAALEMAAVRLCRAVRAALPARARRSGAAAPAAG